MPRKASDPEFRSEIAAKFKAVIKNKGLTKQAAAKELGVTRQSLYLYTKGRVAPGPDVVRKAMELWKIDLTYRGHRLALEDLSAPAAAVHLPVSIPIQMNLWDVIKKLDNQSVKVEIRDKNLSLIELKVSINLGA
jgi:DNA-binding XRE family transcriptional regulator